MKKFYRVYILIWQQMLDGIWSLFEKEKKIGKKESNSKDERAIFKGLKNK